MITTLDPTTHETLLKGLLPPERLTPSQWAEKYRILTQGPSREYGPWRNSRTPFMVEPMDCMDERDPCQVVVVQKSVHVGASESMNNCIGYAIQMAQRPMMVVLPTIEVMEAYSDLRIQGMIRDTPVLSKLISDYSRDSTNQKLMKSFPGGYIKMSGANSAASLRSYAVGYLFCDEVDAWPLSCEDEGSPLDLALKRTDSYPDRKIWLSSTPVEKETSVVCEWYERSSQGEYHVPCPYCAHMQPLIFGHLLYKDRKAPVYECESCGMFIGEAQKHEMLGNGQWVHRFPDNRVVRGFFLNGLYSPVGWANNWTNMATEWQHAQKALKNRNKKPLITFKNLRLAEPVERATIEEDEPDVEDFQKRCEPYPEQMPNAIKVVTAAVDVQGDRLEYEVIGWGADKENWSWEWGEFIGSPGVGVREGVWQQLFQYLVGRTFTRQDGTILPISRTCIDTRGHNTQEVYEFCRVYRRHGVVGVAGYNVPGKPLVSRGKGAKGEPLVLVGTETAKDTIFTLLRVPQPGPGYCHFPTRPEYDEEFFKQLWSEEPHHRTDRGRRIRYYRQRRKRNEKLDLHVYNLVALKLADPQYVLIQAESVPSTPVQPQPTQDSEPKDRWIQDRKGWLKR